MCCGYHVEMEEVVQCGTATQVVLQRSIIVGTRTLPNEHTPTTAEGREINKTCRNKQEHQ